MRHFVQVNSDHQIASFGRPSVGVHGILEVIILTLKSPFRLAIFGPASGPSTRLESLSMPEISSKSTSGMFFYYLFMAFNSRKPQLRWNPNRLMLVKWPPQKQQAMDPMSRRQIKHCRVLVLGWKRLQQAHQLSKYSYHLIGIIKIWYIFHIEISATSSSWRTTKLSAQPHSTTITKRFRRLN